MARDSAALLQGRSYRVLAALFAFVVTGLLGAWGGSALIGQLQSSADERLHQDATRFAESVARGLASQYAKAGQYAIPLEQIPGNQIYLERVLRDTPGVVRIALVAADGRALFRAASPADQGGETQVGEATAPIAGTARALGEVRVRVSPGAMGPVHSRWMFPVGVLIIALAAGALAAWGPGADLAARHRSLTQGLAQGLSNPVAVRGDALDAALRALHEGETDITDKLAQLEALAEELLAVDFDDALAPEIGRVRDAARAAAVLERAA